MTQPKEPLRVTAKPRIISADEDIVINVPIEDVALALKIPTGYVILSIEDFSKSLDCGRREPKVASDLGHSFEPLIDAKELTYVQDQRGKTYMARFCKDCGLGYGRETL